MRKQAQVRLSKNGELRIPSAFRKALRIRAGDEVVMRTPDSDEHN
jgi:bifunctional DNA-binding transcriptional regulator/antitoxin component of YhaV-PrlF toxin-antitoxin module